MCSREKNNDAGFRMKAFPISVKFGNDLTFHETPPINFAKLDYTIPKNVNYR